MLQPEIRISSVAKLFGASGNLTDENTRQHLAKFLEALARWIALIKRNQTIAKQQPGITALLI
jgi:hypothetical protein